MYVSTHLKKHGKPPRLLKVDINLKKYTSLLETYFEETAMKEMTYFYFDSTLCREEAKLFQSKFRFRVRVKGKKYSLELKSKLTTPSQDFIQKLSASELEEVFSGVIPAGVIRDRLIAQGLLCPLKLIRTVFVIRHKRCFRSGVLVLEKTVAVGKLFYQVEFRSYYPMSPREVEVIRDQLGLSNFFSFQPKLKRIWERV